VIVTRAALFCALLATPNAVAFGKLCKNGDRPVDLNQLNARLIGKVHDYTANHGQDRRIAAPSLGQPRDAYVYVPPGYDPAKRYPLVIWLHGLAQDESSFLTIAPAFDEAMVAGALPKFVVIAPDGTVRGKAGLQEPPALYLNSRLGRYEDFIIYDVWNHAVTNYSIRPERGAHVLAGASMGAFGAYNLAIKHRGEFAVVAGVLPPIHLRYQDCRGRTDTNFDPTCPGLMTEYRPNAPVARFGPFGIITIRQRQLVEPVFGSGPDVTWKVAAENPAEMLTSYDVKPGELAMFAGYGSRDEFNFDAQTEAFAYIARGRGLQVDVACIPGGKHDTETGLRLMPAFVEFMRPRLAAYAPKD
jgi:S-formylglutathione hydrolase FrmB